ncbi:hypothetical protein ABHF91_07015 [Pseudaeromonas sp. ZJS20]|uniref:hypothetical protein n=1 Tax=Pseudaeromonas aegiceratis TaxID=3153928 RepID=UPI00390C4C91
MIKELFTTDVYVKVRRNRFEAKNLSTGSGWESSNTQEPFTTDRLLVGQFSAAEPVLLKLTKEIQPKSLFKKRSKVVIQPMEMGDGGLSEVVERIFRELALGAGAIKVILHIGKELSDSEARDMLNGA